MTLNKRSLIVQLITVAFFSISGLGMAQTISADTQAKLTQADERFKAADKNADGKLTLEEAKAGMPRIADAFDHIDVDKKGYVTLDQIKALIIKTSK